MIVILFLHLSKDIAPRLKLVLSDPLAPLEFRMTNDSNFRCDLPSDSNLGRLCGNGGKIFLFTGRAPLK